jgi:hypothetical protein
MDECEEYMKNICSSMNVDYTTTGLPPWEQPTVQQAKGAVYGGWGIGGLVTAGILTIASQANAENKLIIIICLNYLCSVFRCFYLMYVL